MMQRRFPPPWSVEEQAACFIVRDQNGQQLGLMTVDLTGASTYDANAKSYLVELNTLENDVKAAIAKIPVDRRKIITNHGAFGYFGDAYGMEFIAPEGVSTDSEPSAADVAKIITQIRTQKNPCCLLGERHRSQIDTTDC